MRPLQITKRMGMPPKTKPSRTRKMKARGMTTPAKAQQRKKSNRKTTKTILHQNHRQLKR